MRAFYLCRREDVSRTSGTGHVAELAEFDDGSVAVRWVAVMNATGVASTTVFNSLDDLLKVHGHDGRTVLEPVLDSERVRKLEARLRELQESLRSAIGLLESHGVRAPEELRRQAAAPVCPTD